MAIAATDIYQQNVDYFKSSVREIIKNGDDVFNFPGLKIIRQAKNSKKILQNRGPKLIMAGSGMSTGGRILSHEAQYLADPKNCLLLVGYQGSGTLGRQLAQGATLVQILGREIKVRARIAQIGGYSGHGDQNFLLQWLANIRGSAKNVFLVQGEANACAVLAEKIRAQLQLQVVIPRQDQRFEL